jgi:hypothetical protein
MRKTSRKLVLRSQTLRVLHNVDLTRAVGGLDSGGGTCLVVADSGVAACPTGHADAIATAACH